ncbi:retinol dehydrogenase 11-like [Pogonomyrmex barbatus]|uniref:Retinol dehydrogenase 11-like n=1 Tax=Pogonomyrmex barbatus TaxID=144034 RepID=A0A6I9WEH3_9HYME|nr:retinol dehydrogenase 11-like [Pogonomyrmex barbatus]XP_011639338.1 retinol dehydrogenase 11-like [Pogonomyrmex barbatus]
MWTYHTLCTSKARLDGKTAVITGANTGIGKETAKDFYKRGARVILACRNMEKTQIAIEDIKCNSFLSAEDKQLKYKLGELVFYPLDLCSLKSVKECASMILTREQAIHILVNNAGVMMCPYEITEDGFEIQLQSNYLGHFLLTLLLLPKMQLSAPGCRIVNVSSVGYIFGKIHFDDINLKNSYNYFRPWKAYMQSKLANIMFTKELARRLKEAKISGINVYSLHPGVIKTELGRNFNRTIIPGATFFFKYIMRPFIKNPKEGAQTTIYCAVDEKAADETGLYYSECRVTTPYRFARDDQTIKNLWDYTCQLLHLKSEENFSTFLENVSHQINGLSNGSSLNNIE